MNVYCDPEKFGLTIVTEAGYGGYEFDLFVIWMDRDGRLHWGSDTGCSCYTPFEGKGLCDLQDGNIQALRRALDEWVKERPWRENDTTKPADALAKVRDAIKARGGR